MSAHQYDEGHTVAGWTGCGIATVGTVVAGVGVCAVSALLIGAGLGIVAVSVLVTWALHLTGWGSRRGGGTGSSGDAGTGPVGAGGARRVCGVPAGGGRGRGRGRGRVAEGRAVVARESVPVGETAG